jgi:hypothetical protein
MVVMEVVVPFVDTAAGDHVFEEAGNRLLIMWVVVEHRMASVVVLHLRESRTQ